MDILTKIPIFFVVFVIFLLVLNFHYRKSNRKQEEAQQSFWEREQLANSTRKQDISNLPYITIPREIIPQNLGTDSEKRLLELCDAKILNLTGKTNTDLKMEYGVANLEILQGCDDRFTELVLALSDYSAELIDADQTGDARALLEFAVSIQADAKPLYLRLAKLYLEEGESAEIDHLIESAESLNSLSKASIISDLKALKETA